VELAEKRNITLAIESEASNIIDTPENARWVMDEIGSDYLKMILDCANLFHKGTAHPENVQAVIGHAFDLFGKDIVIAHGKDIREGDGIEFCGTGLGIVDFGFTADKLRQAGYKGDMFLHGIYDENDMPRARAYWNRFAQ
jgi:sugar phosphate isomerase/epimerase